MTKTTAKVLLVIGGTIANLILIFAIGSCLCFITFHILKLINPEIFMYILPFIVLISVFLGAKLYQKVAKIFIKKYDLEKKIFGSNNE